MERGRERQREVERGGERQREVERGGKWQRERDRERRSVAELERQREEERSRKRGKELVKLLDIIVLRLARNFFKILKYVILKQVSTPSHSCIKGQSSTSAHECQKVSKKRHSRASAQVSKYSLSTLKLNYCSNKLIHLFARELLFIKKLEIEKTKSNFIISVLKVEY